MNPYSNLQPISFWRNAFDNQLQDIYVKKFDILSSDKIGTAGSCFAQHITKHLKINGFNFLDVEKAALHTSLDVQNKFGYGLYSARYGNIYSSAQLLQLAKEAFGIIDVPIEPWILNGSSSFIDPFRPSIEPTGFDSLVECQLARKSHLKHVRELFENVNCFIFTLGLTEIWCNKSTGLVFPTAPGVIGMPVDSHNYFYKNLSYNEIYNDMCSFFDLLCKNRVVSNNLKFILTVSPVPLTATISGKHVVDATVFSKSLLRSVAGQLERDFLNIDYFPSYEVITDYWNAKSNYNENKRTVKDSSVDFVMNLFINSHLAPGDKNILNEANVVFGASETICEDFLLESFSGIRK